MQQQQNKNNNETKTIQIAKGCAAHWKRNNELEEFANRYFG